MRCVFYQHAQGRALGILSDDGQHVDELDLPETAAERGVLTLIEYDLAGEDWPAVRLRRDSAEVRPRAPLPRPVRNLFCVGKNYLDHAEEFAGSGFDSSAAAGSVPAAPIVFSKVPHCVTAFDDPIPIDPAVSAAIDYEAELAVIIGRGGRAIPKKQALDHVWGYTIVNDVTARDLQGRHSQWLIGKSQDGFCPMGPVATTAKSFNLADARVRCWVNDELRQNATTGQLIFDVPTLIEVISAGITLYPGDVIATGTPAGVGIGFDPPRYLAPGDVVRIEIDGIGVLENPVAAYEATRAGAAA